MKQYIFSIIFGFEKIGKYWETLNKQDIDYIGKNPATEPTTEEKKQNAHNARNRTTINKKLLRDEIIKEWQKR